MSPKWEALHGACVPVSWDTPVPTEKEMGGSPQQLCCAGALTSSVTLFLNSSLPLFLKCYSTSSPHLAGMEHDPGQRKEPAAQSKW